MVFNTLTFDGVNSIDKGIYITGEAVYNAPERQMDMIPIPGRSGALAIDQGRFENITVTYPAGCFGSDQSKFAEKMREFRNILASRYRYVRLEDSYHPDEYRLALYKAGLDVDPVSYSTAGEFKIEFECKPQRFLKSGEIPIELYEMQVLTDHNLDPLTTETGEELEARTPIKKIINPTEFEARPTIITPSPGTINFGGQLVTISGSFTLPIHIDCDMMEIYQVTSAGAVINASDKVSFSPNKFPVLQPGEMSFSTNIGNVEIMPNWWIV